MRDWYIYLYTDYMYMVTNLLWAQVICSRIKHPQLVSLLLRGPGYTRSRVGSWRRAHSQLSALLPKLPTGVVGKAKD